MSSGKFKINKAGFNTLRRSEEMVSVLNAHASEIQARANSMSGGGFDMEVRDRPTRAVAFVRAVNEDAVRACRKSNVLLKSVM